MTVLDLSTSPSKTFGTRMHRANKSIQRDLERVGQIQRSLLPDPLPNIPGLTIAAWLETFALAGGDIYDVVAFRNNLNQNERWAIFIADASGHGPAAAVVIAVVQALLHAAPQDANGPAEVLRFINHHLCQRPIESSFVTAFLGIYEPETRQLVYAGAGHPMPLYKACGEPFSTELRSMSGYPLGIDSDQTFIESVLDLSKGDSLLFYTDGVSEARNRRGELFDSKGIERAMNAGGSSPDSIIEALQQAVRVHLDGLPATDDCTLMALSVL